MKKIVIGILATVLLVFSVSAQDSKGKKHPKKQHEVAGMMKELNLTEAQKSQMKANRESFKQQMALLNKNESITVKESRDRKAMLLKEQKAKTLAILTADQKAKFESLKHEKQLVKEKKSEEKLENLKSKLGLSEEQMIKIRAQKALTHSQMKAIKDNNQLSRNEKHERLLVLREQNKGGIKKFLTPEQVQKLEAMKKNQKEKKES